MIERSGLNHDQASAVLTEGAPGSPLVKLVSAHMTAPDYTPNFLLKLMTKDLGYALQEADELSLELTTAAALKRFQQSLTTGHGEQDMAAVIESIRTNSHGNLGESSFPRSRH